MKTPCRKCGGTGRIRDDRIIPGLYRDCDCGGSPASQLGKMAAGVPKKFSAAEIAKRTARLKTAQKKRAKTQRALRRANGA